VSCLFHTGHNINNKNFGRQKTNSTEQQNALAITETTKTFGMDSRSHLVSPNYVKNRREAFARLKRRVRSLITSVRYCELNWLNNLRSRCCGCDAGCAALRSCERTENRAEHSHFGFLSVYLTHSLSAQLLLAAVFVARRARRGAPATSRRLSGLASPHLKRGKRLPLSFSFFLTVGMVIAKERQTERGGGLPQRPWRWTK